MITVVHGYSSLYQELLKMSGKTTINICNYRTLCNENLKTLNNINPSFVKEIFRLRIMNRPTREKYKLTLKLKLNQLRFGTKCLRYFGSKVWNCLPYHIKSSENLSDLIKTWSGTTCNCKIYQIYSYIVLSLHLLISNLC